MRTTVTLEPDVATRLQELARNRRAPFNATLNDVLRTGLARESVAARLPRFVVEPQSAGFLPGIDPGKLNHLIDDLEAEDFMDEARRT